MKRVLLQAGVWLCCLLMLLTVGCAAEKEVQPVTDGFSCRADVTYRELALQGVLTRPGNGNLQFAFQEPASLSGIILGWDGQAMTMELGGVSIDIAEEQVPQSALIKCLLQVLASDVSDGVLLQEGYTVSGEVQGTAYTLVCDPSTGLPLSLEVPENELYATFTDAARLNK